MGNPVQKRAAAIFLSAVKTRRLPDTEHKSGQARPVGLGGIAKDLVPYRSGAFIFVQA